ncbi:MAG TPA: hypothetical protein VJL81_08505, partial [Solirubrobacterales bacterium]|nr:hypothetical protein [Solirubrobacterales bacterium]
MAIRRHREPPHEGFPFRHPVQVDVEAVTAGAELRQGDGGHPRGGGSQRGRAQESPIPTTNGDQATDSDREGGGPVDVREDLAGGDLQRADGGDPCAGSRQAGGRRAGQSGADRAPGPGIAEYPSTEGESNVASTAWGAQGISASGGDPETWRSGSGLPTEEPLDYMESMQQPDGHIRWRASSDLNGIW